jgi:predicted N-acetyltransferase YhbS
MFTISNETAADHPQIESLLDRGFGTDRHALTVYRLRQAPPCPDLGFVLRAKDGLAASLRFWPISVDNVAPALLLGPLVVRPQFQGLGLGKRMVRHGIDRVTADGWRLCLVVGGPSYYAPFGFEPAAPWGLCLPGPVDQARFQIKALGDVPLASVLPDRRIPVQQWRSVRRDRLSRFPAPPLAA